MVSAIDQYVIQKVREIRKKKKISQSQLAFELDLSTSLIKKIESNQYEHKYNLGHLNELAKILQCSPQDFLPKEPI